MSRETTTKIKYTDLLDKTSPYWKSLNLNTSQYSIGNKGIKSVHLNTTIGTKGKYKIESPHLYSSPYFAFHQQKTNEVVSFISKVEVLKHGLNKYKTEAEKAKEESYQFAMALLALEEHILDIFDKSSQKSQIMAAVGIPNNTDVRNMSYKCPTKEHYLFKSVLEQPRIEQNENDPNQDPETIGKIDTTKSPNLSFKLWTSTNEPKNYNNNGGGDEGGSNFNFKSNDSSKYIMTTDGLYVFTNVLDISQGFNAQKKLSSWSEIESLIVYDKQKRDKNIFKILLTCNLLNPSLYVCSKEIRLMLKVASLDVYHIERNQNSFDHFVSPDQYQNYVKFVKANPELLSQYEIQDDDNDNKGEKPLVAGGGAGAGAPPPSNLPPNHSQQENEKECPQGDSSPTSASSMINRKRSHDGNSYYEDSVSPPTNKTQRTNND